MKKRVLSLILAVVMLLGCLPTTFAAEAGSSTGTNGGPLSLTANSAAAPESSFAPGAGEDGELTKFESSGLLPFSKNEAATVYEADDIVTFIVVTEEEPLLATYSVSDIAAQTNAVRRYEKKQVSALNAVKSKVKSAFGKEDGFEMGFTYTIATTGFSVTTAYGNKAAIEAMKGVKSVYVAPTFRLPEDGMEENLSTFTNNASTMIGANVLNTSGYTGKGMRIAILDTGIRVDHPNFGALPESALEDPMTRESVEGIWKKLNASQMTTMLNLSYYNSKIPYVFNYVSGDFNVSNTYAGSDHGTHVAGIAAANKIDGSNVIGVAPDAQLVVMQVFQQGGGAGWDTIMAALEDCVRLEVDCANLSLGMAAGFTDPADDMLETMDLFLDSDIQLLIASGNDTNSAYGNAWGYDMPLISDPDIGLTGTPGTYSAAMSVASVDNNGYEQLYITVNGQDFGYLDSATASQTVFINNFRNAELEYVVVPGIGAEEDYEGLDVSGKVALVSRGTTSFPEKQAIAQAQGAAACIVYNNTLGIFYMQINDGGENIPCISISKSAGACLIEQAGADGVGTLKVCDAETKLFQVDQTVSSFSSWGVTPDLKLKPEIAGVGGSIYSTVDPDISGSYYGIMSGTSMATPQITGAMAVLIQYLDQNYPELTGEAQRKVAANLLMSTAVPVMASETLEYSPRMQGAGLANLVNATTSGAYLSNPAASEGRPKIEFGDDPDKTGVYTFSFTITNMTGADKTYTFDSSVFTESIYEGIFIAGSPYALEAKVETPDQVTVGAGQTVTVEAALTLTESDKQYLNQFPNGIYVEGYLYAVPVDANDEGVQTVTLTMPMVGFYGDWSDADIFDDPVDYSLYPTVVFTYNSQLGTNPYFRNGKSGDVYNAFSYGNPLAEIDFGMLRNAKYMDITVTDKTTGEVYYELDGTYLSKSYYSASYGIVIPFYLMVEYGEVWDGMDADGNPLPDGTTVTYQFDAWLDDGDDIMDDSWSFDVTLDDIAPELTNAYELQSDLRIDGDRTYLTLDILENRYIAAVMFMSPDGTIMGKYELDNTPGEPFTAEFDITGFGSEFTILVADYACNETETDVYLNLGDQNTVVPEPVALEKDRLYGCETFDSAVVEGGWFSAGKVDFSDPRNETFDSSNRYYSAEYVNGYLVAQSAVTGNLELITPSGSYWSSKTLATNNGVVGDPNVWVLYDMALDHSGTLAASYGVNWETDATDSLLAVGWMYMGDNDNDGHDDGYNALFNIKFTNYGSVNVQPIARISGTDGELLTLGITTEGAVYGIDTSGFLYSVAATTEWDSSVGEWGDDVIKCTMIGATDFVNYPNYGGVNVIQSMGYDHNTGTMYWYAHSQVPNGAYYENINVTYTVNLETAECTEVGTYGPGGQTCLFVPNDLQSDLFTLGADPTNMTFNPDSMYMVEGQTTRLEVEWSPWNAKPAELTWTSADETIAEVDEYGFVTAHSQGTVVISASAEMMLDGYWEVTDGNWIWHDPAMGTKTVNCYVTVVPSQDALYGYVVEDFGNSANRFSWVTYSDKTPGNETVIGKQTITVTDAMTGETVQTDALWQGGTYYNGYVYTVVVGSEDDGTGAFGSASVLYRSKVTKGATPAETTIGEPEKIGYTLNVQVGNLGFDYNTGRMYCVDLTNGGLGIMDLDTGKVDLMGTFSGDIGGAAIATAMCVTADGTIVIADMFGNLYTVDPDTLSTKQIGSTGENCWYYAAMTYDYNTGNIYWNPCMSAKQSPLYLVILPEYEWDSATIVDMGDVSTKSGVEQTVMFTIPDNEPETQSIPVEGIEITNGDSVIGLEGGSLQLNAVTTPARPTVQTKIWTSSDESVVTVDSFGNLTYVGVGTATVTVSITNKDEATYGGPFTDSIEVNVLEAAGAFVAFLNADEGGSGYYDYWLSGNDYDLRHTVPTKSMISIYSLRSGTYYGGYFYGYNDKGQFLRINAEDPADYKILGTVNLDINSYQVTAMAMDYTTSTMYGLTLPSNYDFNTWSSIEQAGQLVTVNLDTGAVTTVASLDFSAPVFALACDASGQLYAAGGTMDYYASSATIYKLDKQTGEQTAYTTIDGACVFTGGNYYGSLQYNTQMTYDFGTDRLYLYATSDHPYYYDSYGMYMIQLGDAPAVAKLGGISLYTRSGSEVKEGDVYLGLLAFIPEEDEVPVGTVNGIILNKTSGRIAVGETTQLIAEIRPANAADTSVTWTTSDPSIATVDENGVVTGVAAGTVTITVTSNETGVTTTCEISVVNLTGPQSVAYTVSAQKDALISFNPALPASTAEVVCTFSGGSSVRGLAYGDNCLYYLLYSNWSNYLYRFDFVTQQSTALGQLYTFSEPSDIAYDSTNNLLYVVGGFYLFQFDVASLDPAGFNYYSNYMMDADYCTLAGVECVDGAVYTLGTDLYSSRILMARYSDMYLSERTVVMDNLTVPVVPNATDMAYDAVSGLFYLTDAGHVIYSVDMTGTVTTVDILGDGIDLNGMTVDTTAKYTVTFTDGVEGEEIFSDVVSYVAPGTSVLNGYRGTPVREGYTFAGWIDADGNPVTSENVAEDNATYTATWVANEYTVTLIFFNGEPDGTITVTFHQPMDALTIPTRAGYTFAGWFLADGITEYTADTVYTVAGNITLYAVWTANTYTVTLDVNGGNMDAEDTVAVTYDEPIGELPVPTRDGYTFLGWFDEDGTKVLAETVYTVAGDSKLTAGWSANAYTITLNAGEGAAVDPAEVNVEYGAAVNTLPVPVKPGYTFTGWVDDQGNAYTAETVYAVAGDITLTATWTANSYTVTLDAGEGAAVDPSAVTVTFGETVGELPAAVKPGYTFAGWVDAEGNPVTAETVYAVAGDITLTATWTANSYTVTLDAGEGAAVDPSTVTVTFGEAVGELPAAVKPGYTFAGWVDAEGNPVTAESVYAVAGDIALTATWTANSYTVTLDVGEGATVDPASVTVTFGEAVGELPVPTRDGYRFDGWVDAEGNKIAADTIYDQAADMILSASWTKLDSSGAKTGDTAPIVIVCVLLIVSACAVCALIVLRKKFGGIGK